MQLTNNMKAAIIVGCVGLLLVVVGFLGFRMYFANQKAARDTSTTTTLLQQKSLEQKEIEQAEADIKVDDDLDMSETDDIVSDLDNIDLQGI